jgi:very-short-patch-repair endonuclease
VNELITIQTNENGHAVSARDLHEALGISKHFTQWFNHQCERLYLCGYRKVELPSTGGRPSCDYLISVDNAIQIAMKALRNPNSSSVLKTLLKKKKIAVFVQERERDEISFGNILNDVLDGIVSFKTQHYIDGFRIDFYCSELKLAVEYDEDFHASRTNLDLIRQRHIANKLGCHFIRVKKGYEIDGLNQIIKFITARRLRYERIS